MGTHRTSHSTAIIDAIVELGESLDYHVRREWKIPDTGPQSEQIDITFFVDERATSPAFAIEVDSSDAPASISNAVKIFGKSTSALIKPFFVFHIFITSAARGHRRQNSETLLATQNYKTYHYADAGDRQEFILDLLDRHRAICSHIDILKFGYSIDSPIWDGVDRYRLIDLAAEWLDAGDSEFGQIAALSINSQNLKELLTRRIQSPLFANTEMQGLSFTGSLFCWPLIFGLRAHAADPAAVEQVFRELRRWQDEPEVIFSSRTSFIGLSREFDVAVAEVAPLVFCILALLFRSYNYAARQLCEQLFARATDGHLSPLWARYALAWCAIASIKVGAPEVASDALQEIDRFGGLPIGIFPSLPGPTFSDEEVPEWENLLSTSPNENSPPICEIIFDLQSLPPPEFDLPELVARILIDDEFAKIMNQHVIRASDVHLSRDAAK